MYKAKQAFSLVEISIVLVIIGFLVASVGQGSKILLRRTQILRVQQLSRDAPLYRLHETNNALVLWYETTLNESLQQTTTNGQISLVLDRNIYGNEAVNASVVGSVSLQSVRNIPMINFSNGSHLAIDDALLKVYRPLEIFLAFAYHPGSGTQPLFKAFGASLNIDANGKLASKQLGEAQFYLANIQCSNSGCTLDLMDENGVQPVGSVLGTGNTVLGAMEIGGGNSYFGEFILFRRILDSTARQEVLEYLRTKWLKN